MFENKDTSKTPLSNLGEFSLIENLTKSFKLQNPSSILGIGDDSALLNNNSDLTLITTDLLVEGIHFDLSYMPLKHLGYKAIMVNLSDIYAMNGSAKQITVSIAASNRFTLEAIQELYSGIALACEKYGIDLIGGDTSSSITGLLISITAIGEVSKKKCVTRSGAKENDLLIVSGDLGGAYMGLQILEREKAVFKVNPKSQPDLSEYSYSVGRQLKPEARKDVINLLNELDIIPTSMIDISDGLSSEVLHLSKSSKKGFQLFEDKLPLDPEVIKISEEFKINQTTAALNGGEDYELLFTIKQKDYEKIKNHPLLSVIGHVTEEKLGCNLVSGLGQQIELTAQGWKSFSEK
jgi:thiamine-monophosphate kinase